MHLTFVDPALLHQTDGIWGRERGDESQTPVCWYCCFSDMPVLALLIPFGDRSNTQQKNNDMSSSTCRIDEIAHPRS